MRRGGRLFLVLGVVIAAIAAVLGFVFLQQQPTLSPDGTQPLQPTAVTTRQVVVALSDIESNTVLTDTETFLAFDEIPATQYEANPDQYFTSLGELQNKLTLRPIGVNEVITRDAVTDAGLSLQIPTAGPNEPRPKAYPFQVGNLTGVADQIKPGDFVDVLGSFNVTQTFLRPGVDEQGQPTIKEQELVGQTTKTLVQNVQVLQILRPQPAPEGTPTPEGAPPAEGPPQTDASGQPVGQGGPEGQGSSAATSLRTGNWVLILAVTDQEAEVIKYSLEQGLGVTLVLRGRGDTAVETTTGATLDLLISEFGLPLPQPFEPTTPGPTP
jgi:pilus assembly protein CpaB